MGYIYKILGCLSVLFCSVFEKCKLNVTYTENYSVTERCDEEAETLGRSDAEEWQGLRSEREQDSCSGSGRNIQPRNQTTTTKISVTSARRREWENALSFYTKCCVCAFNTDGGSMGKLFLHRG